MKGWQWISVKDSLPDIDQYVLWLYESGGIIYECIDKDWFEFLDEFLAGTETTGPILYWIKPEYPW